MRGVKKQLGKDKKKAAAQPNRKLNAAVPPSASDRKSNFAPYKKFMNDYSQDRTPSDKADYELNFIDPEKKKADKKLKNQKHWNKDKSKKGQEELDTEVEIVQKDDSQLINPALMMQDDDDQELDFEETSNDMAKKVQAMNRKGTSKTGAFQSFGLSNPVFKAIQHKGYRIPTPIQRKAIPIIMEGRDVVAMARTGSGKTAAFLIPLLEKLKTHSAKVGARAVILSPSRELALQTLKFVKELGKYTDIRSCLLVGGDSMEQQFEYIASNPDIIIATPGRLMHLIVEMNLNLRTCEYIVFDEADRLFEMGFAEQLREIIHKLPESRQTILFSATLPKTLVDFARAGLNDAALIRLDLDTKISKDLQLLFFAVKMEEKDASLLYILKNMINLEEEMTMIFVPTKHHVDYIHNLLRMVGISSTYIYGALDQTARKIHLARFRAGRVKVLVVTDVAARGIDVPLLDYVINYEFPPAPKVFVHRVGRVARAGRPGTAINLVSNEELPYMLDLQMFLGRSFILGSAYENNKNGITPDYTNEVVYGSIPPSMLGVDMEQVKACIVPDVDLQSMLDASRNGFKLYLKTRVAASKESYARAKEIASAYIGMHPVIAEQAEAGEVERQNLLRSISQFRPNETVFEVGKRGGKNKEANLMVKRRNDLSSFIGSSNNTRAEAEKEMIDRQISSIEKKLPITVLDDNGEAMETGEQANEEDIANSFKTIISGAKKRKRADEDGGEGSTVKKSEYYMSHYQSNANSERGYSMKAQPMTFAEQVKSATMDLNGDDQASMLRGKAGLLWDKRTHKFVRPTVGADNKKMIKTESGALVSSTFKSDRFAAWQKKTKTSLPRTGETELSNASSFGVRRQKQYRHNSITAADPNSKNSQRKADAALKKARHSGNGTAKPDTGKVPSVYGKPNKMVTHKTDGTKGGVRSELKNAEQINKSKKEMERKREKNARPSSKGGKPMNRGMKKKSGRR